MTENTPTQTEQHTPTTEAPQLLRDRLVEAYGDDEMLFIDPPSLDIAIVGIAERCGMGPVVVYDRQRLIQAFMEDDGMNEEDAAEWVSFNVEGAYMGERTPMFISTVVQMLPPEE